jgi:hypothetical protein
MTNTTSNEIETQSSPQALTGEDSAPEWSYSSYRATLYRHGKRFALVTTTDGIMPLSINDTNTLLAALNRPAPELLEALMVIEERYIDGCDTYEDWKFMGDTARGLTMTFTP